MLKTCTRQPAHMEHTKYTTIRTNWYIQQTHVGATNRNANKNNKNYHVLQNQLPLLLTRNRSAKDLYKTTCTHGAHKIHNYKNKLVHTANPFRVYRRGPCPRVQMRPLTACTDEAPPSSHVCMIFPKTWLVCSYICLKLKLQLKGNRNRERTSP